MPPPEIPPPTVVLTRADYARLGKELEVADFGPAGRRVAVLASFTADFFKPYLTVEAARRGLPVKTWLAPYGQIEQQALDPASALHAEKSDVVLILPRIEDLAPELAFRFVALSAEQLEAARRQLVARLRTVLEAVRAAGGAKILLANFAQPAWLAAGLADASLEASQTGFLCGLNSDLAALCRSVPDTLVLDVCRAAAEVGLDRWRDERLDFLAKSPWSADAMVALARHAARRMRSWFLPRAKCLVLDMDNTLWGGVLGEAGVEGIQLGPDYPGNVFLDFQRRVLALRDCGILLAVASKNNAADVEEVFARHPSCLLKREHFAALEVHWEDKAASVRRIAATLNIGLDTLVFFDDNPAERAWVREQLPQVHVIEVPESPLGYARVLAECGCFDLPALTGEDRRRAELYVQDAQRDELKAQTTSLDDFLRGLEMTLTLGSVNAESLPRIVQLLSRTNQFNLTTRRHSAAEVQAMLDRGAIAIWARLRDRFGDNGLIAAAIAMPEDEARWRLDTFLMSCRVIGRGVETALLAAVERLVRARGGRALLAEYLPTSKNQPAAQLLPSHGFSPAHGSATLWQHPLAAARAVPPHLRVDGIPIPS
jgi:FkbH-like protein